METTAYSPVQPFASPQFPATYQRGTQRISLPYLNRIIFVYVDDILCLQGEGNYTFLHTRDRKRYLVSKTLKEFERTLNGLIFLRVHKSHIVNLAYVQPGLFIKDRQMRLADGREVVVSRRRQKSIIQQMAQYGQWLLN